MDTISNDGESSNGGTTEFMGELNGNRGKFDPHNLVLTACATSANETLMFCLTDPGDAFLVLNSISPRFFGVDEIKGPLIVIQEIDGKKYLIIEAEPSQIATFLKIYTVPYKKRGKWILDSGCSKHMTGDKNMLTNIIYSDGGSVTFGDNSKGYIIGKGDVSNDGQPKVDFDQYGGYVTVDLKNGRALYYYLVESPQNSYTKPLLLWLNGGPGCSSLGNGAMMENGPFRVKKDGKTVVKNYYSWNKVANVLYLESPAGTGFSYSNTSSDYESIEDERIATDSYTFLIYWLERFPQYKTRDFFIAGESFAGRMIPQLAQLILHNNKIKNLTTINLRGIAIGNPNIDTYMEKEESYKLFWGHAIISEDLYQNVKDCNFTNGDDMDKKCQDTIDIIGDVTEGIDKYNIYAPNPYCDDPNSTSDMYNPDPCSDQYVEAYLNTPMVQKALHANVTNLSFAWESCSSVTNFTQTGDIRAAQILPIMEELIAERVNIWVYSGDTDSVIPTFATRREIKLLRLPIKNEWYPWFYKNEVGGYVEEYEGLTFVTIRGAGHMVPMDQPERAFLMISNFLEMKLPPKPRWH